MTNTDFLNESPRTLGIEFHQYCLDRECPYCPFMKYKAHSCAIAWYQSRLGKDLEAFANEIDDRGVAFEQLSARARNAIVVLLDKSPYDITHRDLAHISKDDLKKIRNCSSKTISEIVNYFHANNIPFKGEINF